MEFIEQLREFEQQLSELLDTDQTDGAFENIKIFRKKIGKAIKSAVQSIQVSIEFVQQNNLDTLVPLILKITVINNILIQIDKIYNVLENIDTIELKWSSNQE